MDNLAVSKEVKRSYYSVDTVEFETIVKEANIIFVF